jgi:hypothetical protein
MTQILLEAGSSLSVLCLVAALRMLCLPCRVDVLCTAVRAAALDAHQERWDAVQQAEGGVPPEDVAKVEVVCHEVPRIVTTHDYSNLRRDMCRIARTEGLLLDPHYSFRLFLLAESLERGGHLEPFTTIVHTGGALGLVSYLAQDSTGTERSDG